MEKTLMGEETRFRVSQHVLSSRVADDLILMDVAQGLYLSVNETGRQILELLDTNPLGQIQAALVQRPGASKEEVWNDLSTFCADLLDRGLIEVATPPTAMAD
jgi:hypothetical protein